MGASIASVKDLNNRILELEIQERRQLDALKNQASLTMESFKPFSLLKSAVGGVAGSKAVRNNLIGMSLSAAAGMAAGKFIGAGSRGIVKQLAGSVFKKIVAGFAIKKLVQVAGNAMNRKNGTK